MVPLCHSNYWFDCAFAFAGFCHPFSFQLCKNRCQCDYGMQLVVSVMVNMTCGDSDDAAGHAELKAWAKFVQTERPSGLPAPTSMCFQHSELLGNGAPPKEPMRLLPGWSGSSIGHHDSMCGTQFSVHPLSFYQVRDSHSFVRLVSSSFHSFFFLC